MVRAVIPGRVAMSRSGNKTLSIFDRNDTVGEGDLHQAAERLSTLTLAVGIVVNIVEGMAPAEAGEESV